MVLNQSEARIQERFYKIFNVRVRVSFRVGLGLELSFMVGLGLGLRFGLGIELGLG